MRVSPQFYVHHDEFFKTVSKTEAQLPEKVVVGFADYKNTPPKRKNLRPQKMFSFPKTPPSPTPDDDFNFQFKSPSISNEENNVPSAVDGEIQENERIEEVSNTSPPSVTRTSSRIKKPT